MTGARRAGRRRLAVLGAAILAVAAAVILALALRGSPAEPPATGAASVVPGHVLAYLNLSLDRSRPEVPQAIRLARRFATLPALLGSVEARLAQASGAGEGFAGQVRPWLGGEAAVALLRSSRSRARAMVVLSVRNRRAFRRFLAAAGGSGGSGAVRVAAVGGFAVFGDPASIAASQRAASHPRLALAADSAYRAARRGEPADRVLDAYLPAGGLVALLAGRGGLLGAVGALLDAPGLRGVSLAASPAPRGAHVQIHSVFAPRHHASLAAGPPAGTPTLQAAVPAAATLMLDVPDLARAAPRLLAAASVAGVAGQVGPLLGRLGAALRSEGVNVGQLLALFDHEGAVAITSATTRPGLLVLARTPDPAQARVRLADMEPALAALFPPASSGPGAAPVFNSRTVDGIVVHTLQLAPGLQLDYAVFAHLVALSTSTEAIAAVAARTRSLGADPRFRSVLGTPQDPGTSLVFANLNGLIRLGEQIGLLRGATSGALAADLTRIAAIGLRSTGGGDESTAELNLSIP